MSNLFNELKNNYREDPYLIAEIGINHNGDINIVKKLIDASNACDWDCVKFQKRDPDVCVPEEQKSVVRDTPWGEMTYIDYKYRMEFGLDEYLGIDKYCREKPIDWTTSIWDINSLEFMKQFDVPFIKIPSAQITNKTLIESITQINHFYILSTGMMNWKMLDEVVNVLEKNNLKYALLHCNSTYPAPHKELNLSVIPEMKKRYGCIVGYSGHEFDLEPSIFAAVMGAQIIERHVTLNHEMWGTDQKSSLEVHAMDLLQKRMRGIREIMGVPEKVITESEKIVMNKLRG
jgi:N-acetylneuraminate synthase